MSLPMRATHKKQWTVRSRGKHILQPEKRSSPPQDSVERCSQDARRIGSRIYSGSSEQVDRFASSVHSPLELKFWTNMLKQIVKRKKQDLMSIGICDDRFRNDSVSEDA